MEKIPFIFGKIAEKDNFTNREEETSTLIQQFKARNNVVIISPRRWGKSSLVGHACRKLISQDKTFRIVYLDLFNVKTELEFYTELSNKVLKATFGKVEDQMRKTAQFFKKIIPKLSYNLIPESEISISFDWDAIKKHPDEIINLAENIAHKEGFKIVICIDEFQNLHHFEDPMAFQKKLRANWQHHQNVSYCLYGSKEHMMQDIFNNSKYPFYRFAFILNLQKIQANKWYSFIQKKFKSTKKTIKKEEINLIIEIAENQPYYIQQLAQTTWLLTNDICKKEIIISALENMFNQLSTFFLREMEQMSVTQTSFLHALIDNSKKLGSAKTIKKYDLRSTSNIHKIKKALTDKQILRFEGRNVEFHDPIFKIWLNQIYFQK